jgi:hypothetical protein
LLRWLLYHGGFAAFAEKPAEKSDSGSYPQLLSLAYDLSIKGRSFSM